MQLGTDQPRREESNPLAPLIVYSNMAIQTFNIETSMGSVRGSFGHPLTFLTEEEKANLDEIGYTGKLKGVKTSKGEYLNSLEKGEFSVEQTKFDNGDFTEGFLIVRVTK